MAKKAKKLVKRDVLKCPKCGQTEKFYANVVEYHTHLVDGAQNFLDDLGCEDCDRIHPEYRCAAGCEDTLAKMVEIEVEE